MRFWACTKFPIHNTSRSVAITTMMTSIKYRLIPQLDLANMYTTYHDLTVGYE